MKGLKKIKEVTKSFCPICLKVIPAYVTIKNEKIVISKYCRSHGKFQSLHVWDDPYFYKRMWRISSLYDKGQNSIILDLTSRCNLRCPICFAFGGEKELREPSVDEIKKMLVRIKRCHIVLYGGEPTLRNDLPNIISSIKRLGFNSVLLTNGLKLTRRYISQLKKSGLKRVVLQFDGLDENVYRILRGKNLLKKKLKVISNLKKEGIGLDLFVMLVKNVNEDQIHKIISFASKNVKNINTIYFSPMCFEGRMKLKADRITISEVLKIIEEQTGIKKEDFLACTELDCYLSKLIKGFGGIKTPSFCHPICFVYVDKNRLIPINRLIDFRNLKGCLQKTIEKISKSKLVYLHLAHLFFNVFKMVVRKKIRIIEPSILFKFFISILRRNFIEGTSNKIFRIDVFAYQDRYNADFRMFKKCNLIARKENGTFDSFCKRNILQGKIKALEKDF